MNNYKKIMILRTNALVGRPNATLEFGNDNCIVIPLVIIDELEKISRQYTERGKNARNLLEYLDTFDIKKLKSEEGIRQKNGSILRIETAGQDEKVSLPNLSNLDRQCLQIALKLRDSSKKTTILITKNPALRIKAKSLGIKAQDVRDDIFPSLNEQYTGRIRCQAFQENIDKFYADGYLLPKDIYNHFGIEWTSNLFLQVTAIGNANSSIIARYNGEKIVPLRYENEHPFGITTKKAGQIMAKEALLESPKTAPLVVIKGGAGTGKTYLSLAAALEKTLEDGKIYNRILVTTPTQSTIGKENLGYLPGSLENKFDPHLGGIMDNLRILFNADKNEENEEDQSPKAGSKKKNRGNHQDDDKGNTIETGQSLFAEGIIQMQLIGYLRGRSIVKNFFIIDETQNIHPDDIKSIVTRASLGSKFVFLGDPTQIDNPLLNERYNGLVYLSEKMKDSDMAYIITLEDSESVRSPLAKYAATIL